MHVPVDQKPDLAEICGLKHTHTFMKTTTPALKKITTAILGFLIMSVAAVSCTKDPVDNPDTGVHKVDPSLVGKWMWTKGSSGAYYDNNGVYKGAAYGFATQYTINADGTGTCFSHVYSTLGLGTGLEVNISYKGFFESDDQGHLGFFPTGGTYTSSSSGTRSLRSDELWNVKTGKGRNFIYQKVTVTTQGGRACFQVTSSDGSVDSFFKQ